MENTNLHYVKCNKLLEVFKVQDRSAFGCNGNLECVSGVRVLVMGGGGWN